MFPDHFVRERKIADEQHAPKRDQRRSLRLFLWHARVCVLLVLALFGLYLLATGPGTGKGDTLARQHSSSDHISMPAGLATSPGAPSTLGTGAGAAAGKRIGADSPVAQCNNPFDVTCLMQNAAQWMAQQIMNALQPVIGAILKSPLNILTQTPPVDTYQNTTVITWSNGFLAVVDLALVSLIVIGGYNVVVGRHLGLNHAELAEFLPRLILAVGAAHFSLYFLGLFIDLENALCSVALNLAGTSTLTNIITALFQGNLVGEGHPGGAPIGHGG